MLNRLGNRPIIPRSGGSNRDQKPPRTAIRTTRQAAPAPQGAEANPLPSTHGHQKPPRTASRRTRQAAPAPPRCRGQPAAVRAAHPTDPRMPREWAPAFDILELAELVEDPLAATVAGLLPRLRPAGVRSEGTSPPVLAGELLHQAQRWGIRRSVPGEGGARVHTRKHHAGVQPRLAGREPSVLQRWHRRAWLGLHALQGRRGRQPSLLASTAGSSPAASSCGCLRRFRRLRRRNTYKCICRWTTPAALAACCREMTAHAPGPRQAPALSSTTTPTSSSSFRKQSALAKSRF